MGYLAVMLLSGALLWGAAPHSQDANADIEAAVVKQVNNLRAQEGLEPLVVIPDLAALAALRALDMVDGGPRDHRGGDFDADDAYDIMKALGCYGRGENIAWFTGFERPEWASRFVYQWRYSPSHYRNMMNPRFTHIGVGVEHGNGATYGVQLLCAIRGAK